MNFIGQTGLDRPSAHYCPPQMEVQSVPWHAGENEEGIYVIGWLWVKRMENVFHILACGRHCTILILIASNSTQLRKQCAECGHVRKDWSSWIRLPYSKCVSLKTMAVVSCWNKSHTHVFFFVPIAKTAVGIFSFVSNMWNILWNTSILGGSLCPVNKFTITNEKRIDIYPAARFVEPCTGCGNR